MEKSIKTIFGEEGVTSYRNPAIAEAFKNLGFIERFGFGIPHARKTLRENGNPDPKFQTKGAVVLVTVKPKKSAGEKKGGS